MVISTEGTVGKRIILTFFSVAYLPVISLKLILQLGKNERLSFFFQRDFNKACIPYYIYIYIVDIRFGPFHLVLQQITEKLKAYYNLTIIWYDRKNIAITRK